MEYPAGSFAYQNSVRYRGYVYDQETGLYYLQSRYYDPETGRFINADDPSYIGAGGSVLSYNAFAYCENNPVNDWDPSGTISVQGEIKLRYTKYYVYVYKYKFSYTGHIDFSINGTIYSFGSNGASMAKKIRGTAGGYLSMCPVDKWHEKMQLQKTVRISLTESEYYALLISLTIFINICVSKTNLNSGSQKNTRLYAVTFGTYSHYKLSKTNCATFVRDFVIMCAPDLFGVVENTNKYNSLITPNAVFNEICKKGKLL